MAPFSERYPKPILPICNKPLIQYQIEFMKALGIRDIVVLVGHKGFEISKVLGDGRHLDVTIRYVEQTQMLGIAHAVGRLEPYIDRPFLLFLGDIFFVPGDLQQMLALFEEQGGGAVLAAKEERDPEAVRRNFSITLSPDGLVTRVIEKPRYTSNLLKGVGLYLFDLTVFDAIRRTPRTAMRDEYEITNSIQVMIDDGRPVRAAQVILDDINLTTPADLLHCNLQQARVTSREALVGPGSQIHPHTHLENSVIGAHVTIEHPIHIANSVIFDHTRVQSTISLEQVILTPDGVVDCKYAM